MLKLPSLSLNKSVTLYTYTKKGPAQDSCDWSGKKIAGSILNILIAANKLSFADALFLPFEKSFNTVYCKSFPVEKFCGLRRFIGNHETFPVK